MPQESLAPMVSIIILNWNGRDDTLECLSSLLGLDYPHHEVVVVDNGSSDGSVAAVKASFPDAIVLENRENLGFSAGNNRGIEIALEGGSDYVLILNNDTTAADPDFLAKLVAFAESHPDAGMVGPLILYQDSDTIWFAGGRVSYLSGFSRHMGKGMREVDFDRGEPYTVDYISGCCLLARREVLEKVGLFDPVYFLYYEDTDLSFRARRAGFSNYVVPSAFIRHKKSSTAGVRGENRLSLLQSYYFARNALIFARKHLSGWRRGVFLFSQFTFRLAYNLLHMEQPACLRSYLRGLMDGARTPLS